MINVDKLVGAIYAKGWNKGDFAKAMGKRSSWLSIKLRKKNFTLAEADAVVSVLNLSANDAMEIFFAQFVA